MLAKARVHIFGHADVKSPIRILDNVYLIHQSWDMDEAHQFSLMGLDWVQGSDLNRGPSGYEPDELPDCSTLQC